MCIHLFVFLTRYDLSHAMRKPVFGVYDWARLKPVGSATKLARVSKLLDIAGIVIILSKQRKKKGADQTARMRRLICAFVVCIWHKQVFS